MGVIDPASGGRKRPKLRSWARVAGPLLQLPVAIAATAATANTWAARVGRAASYAHGGFFCFWRFLRFARFWLLLAGILQPFGYFLSLSPFASPFCGIVMPHLFSLACKRRRLRRLRCLRRRQGVRSSAARSRSVDKLIWSGAVCAYERATQLQQDDL